MLTGGPWQAASTSGQSLRSVDTESPGEPREGTPFGLPQILLRLTVIAILLLGIVRHVPAPRQGLGVFRHTWVSGKRSQTL